MGLATSRTSTCTVTFPTGVSLVLWLTEWLSAPVILALLANGIAYLRHQTRWVSSRVEPTLSQLNRRCQGWLTEFRQTWPRSARETPPIEPAARLAPETRDQPGSPRTPIRRSPQARLTAARRTILRVTEARLAAARRAAAYLAQVVASTQAPAAAIGPEEPASPELARPRVPGAITILTRTENPPPEVVTALRRYQREITAHVAPRPGPLSLRDTEGPSPALRETPASPDPISPREGPVLRPRPLRRPPKGCCASIRSKSLG